MIHKVFLYMCSSSTSNYIAILQKIEEQYHGTTHMSVGLAELIVYVAKDEFTEDDKQFFRGLLHGTGEASLMSVSVVIGEDDRKIELGRN